MKYVNYTSEMIVIMLGQLRSSSLSDIPTVELEYSVCYLSGFNGVPHPRRTNTHNIRSAMSQDLLMNRSCSPDRIDCALPSFAIRTFGIAGIPHPRARAKTRSWSPRLSGTPLTHGNGGGVIIVDHTGNSVVGVYSGRRMGCA